MSIWSIDAQTVTHSIQLAVAPVFFLTAVAGMIGSVAGRLARIIDRARKLEESLRTATDHELIARSLTELHGGRMTIDSTLGEGAAVMIRLPVMVAAEAEMRADAVTEPTPTTV